MAHRIRNCRVPAALLAGALLLAPLTGCSFTSHNVSCSGSTCSVTLSGQGSEADILGTTLTFDGAADGQATLGVAGQSVTCTEGQSVSAGPLRLECSSVTDDSVQLTASLG